MNNMRLITVHAHPDDEASKGAALVAKYVDLGVEATLVCCTGGELGSILNPVMDTPEVLENLASVRRAELAASASIIGFDRVEMLGFLDSGMPESEGNDNPENFANADLDDAVSRLTRIIREVRPQVMITYSDDQGGYPHPDHLRTHEVSIEAFKRCGDASYRPDLGEPWKISKVYYNVWSRVRAHVQHEVIESKGMKSPFTPEWLERFNQDDRITTKVDVGEYLHIRDDALRAHATQVDPAEPFWFGVTPEEMAQRYPWDDYILAFSNGDFAVPEADLFAGLDAP